jgi:hypothetical protein
MLTVRRATQEDVPRMLDLAEARRQQYAEYQPQFWRPAAHARVAQNRFFNRLVADPEILVFVGEDARGIVGFIIGTIVPAPPVYNPGGSTCLVDDFCPDPAYEWREVGPPLLAAIRSAARERQAAQLVIVCGHLDAAKREILFAEGATIASEWFVQSLS